jgi:hypothetical protein
MSEASVVTRKARPGGQGDSFRDERQQAFITAGQRPFEEQHYAVAHWARIWGFSQKTIREWFRDEYGPGILRQPNLHRRLKRDYTTLMISSSAAARVYTKRTAKELIH